MKIETALKSLVSYSIHFLGGDEGDRIYLQNLLLRELSLTSLGDEEVDEAFVASLSVPDPLLNVVKDYLVKEKGLCEAESERESDAIMGILSPRPSEVRRHFFDLYKEAPHLATDYLYDLSIKNDYIKKSKVDKNIHWNVSFPNGSPLEISINLSKPEKNNKDIAKAQKAVVTSYPTCLLCKENEGFAGNERHPSRENLRIIPLNMNGGTWYLQFSPYVYYPEHCIVFYEKHIPMAVNEFSLRALFSFVDIFPHYFIGSNSDLPIVGGSILSHEHFQGGGHDLPLLKASFKKEFEIHSKVGTKLYLVDFYDTSLCVSGTNKEDVISFGLKIMDGWKKHDDPQRDIISNDKDGRHSTSTCIVKKIGDTYRLYIILRNNRCSEAFPEGIFHAHPEFFPVKKEGIGLIEAAGLFILPARLERQTAVAAKAVKNNQSFEDMCSEYPDMNEFEAMYLSFKNGLTAHSYLSGVCRFILGNVAVYKDTDDGLEGLSLFIGGLGL